MNNIEVELRSQFDKKTYDRVFKFLTQNAEDLGADDKRVWFFFMPDRLLKVTDNVSKRTGKVTLKLTKIGHGSAFEEIEYPIAEDDVEKAVKIFETLGHIYLVEPTILRHDFRYQGVEIAIKYSKTWGYHLELEMMVASKADAAEAETKMHEVARELGVKIMTDEELLAFTSHVEATYVNPTHMPAIR